MGIASERKAEELCSNPSECQIFHLFRCVLSSLLPLRSVVRSNFDKGLHHLITLIKKTLIQYVLLGSVYWRLNKDTSNLSIIFQYAVIRFNALDEIINFRTEFSD